MNRTSIKVIVLISLLFGFVVFLWTIDSKEEVFPLVNSSVGTEQVIISDGSGISQDNNSANSNVNPQEKFNLAKNRLIDCFSSNECAYPQSDPRAYFFAVGEDMSELLESASQAFNKGDIQPEQLRELAHDLLKVPNGHVQSKALSTLKQLPLDNGTFTAIYEMLQENFDAVLFNESLEMMEAYHRRGFSNEIDGLFQRQLQTGGHFIKHALSKNLLPFINTKNLSSYQETANKLSSKTFEFKQLNALLEEFRLRQQGG